MTPILWGFGEFGEFGEFGVLPAQSKKNGFFFQKKIRKKTNIKKRHKSLKNRCQNRCFFRVGVGVEIERRQNQGQILSIPPPPPQDHPSQDDPKTTPIHPKNTKTPPKPKTKKTQNQKSQTPTPNANPKPEPLTLNPTIRNLSCGQSASLCARTYMVLDIVERQRRGWGPRARLFGVARDSTVDLHRCQEQ